MTSTLVTCRACKSKIDRDLAYKVGEKSYYCSEKEYLFHLKDKEIKPKEKKEKDNKKNKEDKKHKITKKDVMALIFNVFEYKVTNTLLSNKLGELAKIYTYESIYAYIEGNLDFLNRMITNRAYSDERHKINYFLVLIKNNIVDYLDVKKYEEEDYNQDYIKVIDFDFPEIKYKSTNKRRSLYEIEMELMEEDE